MSTASSHSLTGNRIEFRQVQGRRVVRRHWSSTARASWLGANREAELAAHRAASQAGLAPQIIGLDSAAGWMDIEWIEAAPIVVDELLASSARSALWLLLDRLRKLGAPQVPRLDVSTRIEELLDRLTQIDSAASLRWRSQWQLLRAGPAADLSTARGVSQMGACLVHGDLHSGNVLRRADGRLVCIDWEYAHTGGPLEDLAGLLSGSALLQTEWQTAQEVSAPRPDWWPADVFDALACHGHAEQVHVLDWWVEARRLLDGVWMTLAAHSAGNTPHA